MNRKLLEDLQEEIVEAIRAYCDVRTVRGMAFGRYHDVLAVVNTFKPEYRGLIWQFYDTVEALGGADRVRDYYRALGRANKHFFWLTVFGWALCDGITHYTKHHQGRSPEDTRSWLYAVLTADDLHEVNEQEF